MLRVFRDASSIRWLIAFLLDLDTPALPPKAEARLESLTVDPRLDELHRDAKVLDLEVSALVIEKELHRKHGRLPRKHTICSKGMPVFRWISLKWRSLEPWSEHLRSPITVLTRVDFRLLSAPTHPREGSRY